MDATKRNESELEQTLFLIKPDALKHSRTGYIFQILSGFHTGLYFVAQKIVQPSEALAREHYTELRREPFFEGLIEYLTGKLHYPKQPHLRRVLAYVYEGKGAIKKIRRIMGPTNPNKAKVKFPGTIRTLGGIYDIPEGKITHHAFDNLVHGSADKKDAEREIKLWFKPTEMPPRLVRYETAVTDEYFYYRDGRIFHSHVTGSICLLAPPDISWKSDLINLKRYKHDVAQEPTQSLASIVLKYMMNEPEQRK